MRHSLGFIECFKSLNFTQVLVDPTEVFNLVCNVHVVSVSGVRVLIDDRKY